MSFFVLTHPLFATFASDRRPTAIKKQTFWPLAVPIVTAKQTQ